MELKFIVFNQDNSASGNGNNSPERPNPQTTPANDRDYIEKGTKPDTIDFPKKPR